MPPLRSHGWIIGLACCAMTLSTVSPSHAIDASTFMTTTGADYGNFGYAISSTGDFNGDGIDDLALGAQLQSTPTSSLSCRVQIYFGGAAMDSVPDLILQDGNIAGNAFGHAVAFAGDLNGDGYDDLVVGAPAESWPTPFGYQNAGAVWVYLGGATPDATPDLTIWGETPPGAQLAGAFGGAVAAAGDVNDDGYPDFLVGDELFGPAGSTVRGRVYVFQGGPVLTGTPMLRLTVQPDMPTRFGRTVSGVGDVNGDGYDDFAVTMGPRGVTNAYERAHVYFGSAAPRDSIPDLIFHSPHAWSGFAPSVEGLGDVNGDGYADFGFNDNYGLTPNALIFLGAALPDTLPDITVAGVSKIHAAGDVNLDGVDDWWLSASTLPNYEPNVLRLYLGSASRDTFPDASVWGQSPGEYFGSGVSGRGDITGDARPDLVVGAPAFYVDVDNDFAFLGRVYAFRLLPSAPQLSAVADQVVAEGESLTVVPLIASNPDSLPVWWDAIALPPGATQDQATGTIRWTPNFGQAGVYAGVGVIVEAQWGSDTTSFTITVTNVNQPPEIVRVPNQTVPEGTLLTVTPSASDPDGDVLTWSGTSLPPGSSVAPVTGVLTWTPDYTQAGLYSGVALWADDGHAGVDSTIFWIDVTNVNRPPVVAAVPNQTVPEGTLLTVTPSASDPDGDTVTWSGTGLPLGASLAPATGVVTWTPDYTQAGVYGSLALWADDGHGGTDSAAVWITVTNVNRAPTVAPLSPVTVVEGDLVTVTPSGSDPDGDALTWSGSNLPPAASVSATTGVLSWQTQMGDAGTYPSVTLTATDGTASASAAFLLTVLPPVTVALADTAILEGDGGTTNAVFRVWLSRPAPAGGVNVGYATHDGTATVVDGDYVATSGTLAFAAGSVQHTVTVSVLGDLRDEAAESFELRVFAPAGAILADSVGVGTILNDDTLPVLSVADTSATESDGSASVAVRLTPASGQTVTVQYATADGTAQAPGDYAASAGTLTFAPSETLKWVTIPLANDTTRELTETCTFHLTAPVNATLGDSAGLVTILDDDPIPALTLGDVALAEGASGLTTATLTITLSNPSVEAVTVHFATGDGSATLADSDYVAASGDVTIPAGASSQTITVTVRGDVWFEYAETIVITLSTPVHATLADGSATVTVQNDDPLPQLSVNDVSVTEGNAGSVVCSFTVALSGATHYAVSAAYTTANGSATTADGDYAAATGTLSFPAGAPGAAAVAVTVLGDTWLEAAETFTLRLSAPSNAAIADSTGVGTILNDDTVPGLVVGSVSTTEGASGNKELSFPITLTGATGVTVSAHYATADGTALVSNNDYLATSGTVTFIAGQTSRTVVVQIVGDTTYEPDETFTLQLSAPVNASLKTPSATGTLINDDLVSRSVVVLDASVAEGASGTTTLTVMLQVSGTSALPGSVHYTTQDGTATAASGDYAAASGEVLIPAGGNMTVPLALSVHGDALYEASETFSVLLSAPVNVAVVDSIGVASILNDDAPPVLAIGDASTTEGASGVTQLAFPLALSTASGLPVTLQYATVDGSAIAGSDYTAASGTRTIAAGATADTLWVPILGDAVVEPDESFSVVLQSPTGATMADSVAIGTILNDDIVTAATDPTATLSAPALQVVAERSGGVTVLVTLPVASPARADVWTPTGKHVRTLADGRLPDGVSRVRWDGTLRGGHPAAAGVYVVTLRTPSARIERTVVLFR